MAMWALRAIMVKIYASHWLGFLPDQSHRESLPEVMEGLHKIYHAHQV